METRKFDVRVSYQASAYRSAELELEVPPDTTDPLEDLSVEQVNDLRERVIQADPLMKLDDDEDDGFAVQVDIFDVASGDAYSLDTVDGPQFLTQREQSSKRMYDEVKVEKMGSQRLEDLLVELRNDPIFAMSRGSSELFHSNFLAWVLIALQRDALPMFMNVLDIDVELPMPCKVRREWHSFDLAVEIGNTDLVIVENKFKSLPRVGQLRQYAEKAEAVADGRSLHLVLLSPSKPQWIEENDLSWTHLSYDALLSLLKELSSHENQMFEQELLMRYCATVRRLLDLRESCSTNSTPEFFPGPPYGLLYEYRVHDLVLKCRFDELALLVEELLGDRLYLGIPKHFWKPGFDSKSVLVSTDFTNGTALVDTYVRVQDWTTEGPKDTVPIIGIQLQHNLLRLAVINVKEDQAMSFLRSPSIDCIFRNVGQEVVIADRRTKEKEFNSYGPWYKYRYVKIDEENRIDVKDIARLVVSALDQFKTACYDFIQSQS